MTFTDVAPGAWYAQFVETAALLGLMEGYPDGSFRPDQHPTRAELATALVKLANADLALHRWANLRLRSRAAPAVVQVRTSGGSGAGVVVHPAGYVVTCHHVVATGAPGQPLECVWTDWEAGRNAQPFLDVVQVDPAVDLAICQIQWPAMADVQGFPWLPVAEAPEQPAEPVVMLGSPAGIPGWESFGMIARPEIIARVYQMDQDLVCISGAVNPGNSGGALVRAADATLLGIVNAKLVAKEIEGMAFAIPAAQVAHLMAAAGLPAPVGS